MSRGSGSPDMAARFAIYYAPDPASGFWQRASAWLGRDAATDAARVQPAVPGIAPTDFAAVTADPRHYGFHATLKAPFALRPGRSEQELTTMLDEFAAATSAFASAIAPRELGRFVAFRPERPCSAIQELHEAAVCAFEPFRAPLGPDDLARRRKAGLTELQDQLMCEWGYPYVFDQFRFHMTLTNGVGDPVLRAGLLAAATDHFQADTGPHAFDSVSLFRQEAPGTPFVIAARAHFTG